VHAQQALETRMNAHVNATEPSAPQEITPPLANDGDYYSSFYHTSVSTSTSSTPAAVTDDAYGAYYFYQVENGQMIFLHPVCVDMLAAEYPDHHLPEKIEGHIIEKEEVTQSEKTRKRYKFFGHLPITSNFYLVEIDMSSLVSQRTLEAYSAELQKKAQRRKRKQQIEYQQQREKQREEQAQQELERQRAAERRAEQDMLARMSVSGADFHSGDEPYTSVFYEVHTSDSDHSSSTPTPSTTPPASSSFLQSSSTPPRATTAPAPAHVHTPARPTWANLIATNAFVDPFFHASASPALSTSPSSSSSLLSSSPSKPSFADALKNQNQKHNNIKKEALPAKGNNNSSKGSKKKQLILLSNTGSRSYS